MVIAYMAQSTYAYLNHAIYLYGLLLKLLKEYTVLYRCKGQHNIILYSDMIGNFMVKNQSSSRVKLQPQLR